MAPFKDGVAKTEKYPPDRIVSAIPGRELPGGHDLLLIGRVDAIEFVGKALIKSGMLLQGGKFMKG
ncbi:MAG: hypothetical protein RL030_738 [Pseudomonadota bacterium]|jgi:hypothetical protein